MDPMRINNLNAHLSSLEGTGQLPGRPEIEILPPKQAVGAAAQTDAPSFGDVLADSLKQVNTMMNTADQKSTDLATGKSDDLHGTLLAMQKADIAFRMTLEVRNKVMRAYEEVMRMQI